MSDLARKYMVLLLLLQEQASPRDVRRIMMRGRKVAAWKRLTLPERDVLTCLTAICKVSPSPMLAMILSVLTFGVGLVTLAALKVLI